MRATKKFITSVYYRGLPSLSVSITLYLCFPCEIKKRDNNVDQRLGCISVNPSISSSRFLIFPGDKSCLPTAVTNLLLEDWSQNAICSALSPGNGGAPGQLEAHTAPQTKGHGWNALLWAIYPLSFRHWVTHRWYIGRLWGSSLWIHQERKLFVYRQWKCSYKTASWPRNAGSHCGSNSSFRYSTLSLNNYCCIKWADQKNCWEFFWKEKNCPTSHSRIKRLLGFQTARKYTSL